MSFLKSGNTITQSGTTVITADAYDSEATYVDGNQVSFGTQIYVRSSSVIQTGTRLLVNTATFATLGNTRNMQIQVENAGTRADKFSDGLESSNSSRNRFQFWNNFQGQDANSFDRPGMRGSNADSEATKLRQFNANVVNGASGTDFFTAVQTSLNESGEVRFGASSNGTVTGENWGVNVDEVGTDGTDSYGDFYWNDSSIPMTMSIIVAGTMGITIDATAPTRTVTKPDIGTPDVNESWRVVPTLDTDLSGLAGIEGVTVSYQGSIPNYNPGAGVSISVAGTLTMNPEVDALDSEANRILTVKSGGTLYLGKEITSTVDGSVRKSVGLAISGTRAQPVWYGGSADNSSFGVEDGGTLIVKGCTTEFAGMPFFAAGSHVWIDGWQHNCHDYGIEAGAIDPQTGVTVVAGVGVNTDAGASLFFSGRGQIGWNLASDIRVDAFELIGGGEFAFGAAFGAGNNTLSGTPNGFFGYSAAGAKAPVLVDQQLALAGYAFISSNIRLANLGNSKAIALQSAVTFETVDEVPNIVVSTVLGEAHITNAYNGTELTLGSDKLVADRRNFGYETVGRAINVDIRNGLTGELITGGAFFYRDYNVNNKRLNLNGIDNTSDETFISPLTNSNLSLDHRVVEKIVNILDENVIGQPYVENIGGTSNDIRGINRSFDFERTTGTSLTYDPTNFGAIETTDVINFYITTSGGATSHISVTSPTAGQTLFSGITIAETSTFVVRIFKIFNTPFIGDLRTKSGVEGEDTFDFVFWHPEYGIAQFIDFDLRDDTLGTITLTTGILKDPNYSNTSSAKTTADTIDELYDFIKQTKSDATEAFATGIEYPTKFTLAVSKAGGELLDIGSRTFETKVGTEQYELDNSSVKAHTTAFAVGTSFKGILTTASANLTNVTLAGGVVYTALDLTNLPTAIGSSTLNPTNAMTGIGGHTATSESIINSDLTITGTAKNVFGGVINGTFTLTGGDTDFNGSVDEVGGLTTGNISLDSVTKRTVDFKTGSITQGTIIASTATNLVLDGSHEKAITRATGTATTNSSGTLLKELTVGDGVLTTSSTFDARETVTGGDGNHNVDGLIAKAVVLGNGASTVPADILAGGLDMGTGHQTIAGSIIGTVVSLGSITSLSTFIGSSTLTANTGIGDSAIDGIVANKVTLGAANTKHTVNATINSVGLVLGTGTQHEIGGDITGTVASDGTLNTTETFQCSSTVTANSSVGDSSINSNSTGIAGKVTLGNATTKHTINAKITTGGLQLGTGIQHEIGGDITGPTTSTGTLATTASFQCIGTVTSTAIGNSIIDSNSTGISGKVTLGNATTGHIILGTIASGGLQMGTGVHTINGDITGAVATTGTMTTGLVSNFSSTITSTATGTVASTIRGTLGGKLTLTNGDHNVSATITSGGMTLGAGNNVFTGNVTGTTVFGAGDNTIGGTITGALTIGAGDNTLNGVIVGNTVIGDGATALDSTITGNLTTGTGDITPGFNFSMNGTFNPGSGTIIFKAINDVSAIDLVALDDKHIIVYGKAAGDFKSIDQSSTGTITFPVAATRLTISLSSLPAESHYVVLNDSVVYASGEVSQEQADLELSSRANDGDRTHISSGFGGNWYIHYVDYNKQATFKGIIVTETTSVTDVAEFTLAPTEFSVAFEVPAAVLTNPIRTLSVSGTSSTVQPTNETTCIIAGGTWANDACTNASRPEFDLGGCPVGNWADETQSSALVAHARNSVNYLTEMAKELIKKGTVVPTNGSVVNFDSVRPVPNGADWREGRYYIVDTDDGAQKVSGWYEVEDLSSFSRGTRTDRELTDLASLVLDDGDIQIISCLRLLASADEIATKASTVTLEELKDPLNKLGGGVNKTSIGAYAGVPVIK